MTELVTIELDEGVADVRLNRPDKHNALSPGMFEALIDAGERLCAEPAVRAVVLSGNGPSFCAGLDFSSFQGMKDRGDASAATGASAPPRRGDNEDPANHAQRPCLIWQRVPVPVIAAVHGVAFGGGLQVALGADLRFATADARLSIMEIKWGLIPDMGLTQTIRDLLPLDVVKELTFTGRQLSGDEAKALGLVTRVCADPRAEALALAREIAGKSPDAIRAGKRLLNEAWRADARTGLSLEASLQGSLIGSPNQLEAVSANFEKRAPAFSDAAA
jgi:enoyl-CoA hydratase/carnithine racemase